MPATCRPRSHRQTCAVVPSASVRRHATTGDQLMTPEWPEGPDEKPDPALAPLIEAGEGGGGGVGGLGAGRGGADREREPRRPALGPSDRPGRRWVRRSRGGSGHVRG